MKPGIKGWVRARLWLLALLATALVAPRSLAQEQPPRSPQQTGDTTPASGAERAERERAAKAAFDAGVAAAEAGDYARARSMFMRSRQLVVKASTLLNLALADLKLGLVEEALFALDALDAPASGPEHARLRERARQLRSEAERLHEAESAVPLDPDSASAEVVAPAASEAAAAPPPSAHASLGPAAAQLPPEPGPSLLAPRTLLGVGGALLAGTIGAALWWSERSQAHAECHKEGEVCLQSTQIERQQRAARALTWTLGLSGLALVTGGGIWLARRKHDHRARVAVAAWGHKREAGLAAALAF